MIKKHLIKTIDLETLSFKKIVKYYEASNEVVQCIASDNDHDNVYILKIKRNQNSDFSNEVTNLNILFKNKLYLKIPYIREDGIFNDKHYIIYEKITGDKLVDILRKDMSLKYDLLYKYGRELALIHKINNKEIKNAPIREFYKMIVDNQSKIKEYVDYLNSNKIVFDNNTFIHGDFHYDNVLFNKKSITGIIDFEYSGMGFKEMDIAFAIVYRDKMNFFDNISDIKVFLNGYNEENSFDASKLKWCIINVTLYFYVNSNSIKYHNKLLKLLKQFIKL